MRFFLYTFVLVVVCVLSGCGQEKAVDDNKPAPAPHYKMVPAQNSGGG